MTKATGAMRLQLGVRWHTPEGTGLTREELESASECTSVVLRVEWLELFLSTGRYRGRLTDVELAPIWGVSLSSLGNYVAEASRRLATGHAPERAEEIRARLLARIDRLGEAALNRRKEVVTMGGDVVSVADPDCRTALQAVVEFATLTNIREQRWRAQVDLTKMSEGDIMAELEKHGFKIERTRAPMLAQGETVSDGEATSSEPEAKGVEGKRSGRRKAKARIERQT